MNYYNEIDPFAAQMLRNLIDAGHIAPGVVDERSIEDVRPSDLAGYTQCHFFAGVGVWSCALRRAGWPDDKPVWTGSCPCQPFSAAGKGLGFADQRHLWPTWHYLIEQCQPAAILGEQVASKDADPWLDLVHTDLEALGYAFGAVPFPSAGIGAPHIRDRTYWVAHSDQYGRGALPLAGLHDAEHHVEPCGGAGWLGDTVMPGRQPIPDEQGSDGAGVESTRRESVEFSQTSGDVAGPGPTNGPWRDADWLLCRDGKWRPVEPGTFPLAHGAPARVGRLRAYGNAINAEAARVFIEAVME